MYCNTIICIFYIQFCHKYAWSNKRQHCIVCILNFLYSTFLFNFFKYRTNRNHPSDFSVTNDTNSSGSVSDFLMAFFSMNPFISNALFLYPLKTSENYWTEPALTCSKLTLETLRCEIFSKLTIKDHPHSTCVQKWPKLEPLLPYTQSYAFGLTPLYAYVHSIYSCPLLINFYSDSSFRHSQFLGYFHF